MRVWLGVVAGLAVSVLIGWTVASRGEAPPSAGPVERADTPRSDALRTRVEAPTLGPVPDLAVTTPKPGTRARRRAPDAPSRLPVEVEVIGTDGRVAENVTLGWARSETATEFRRMQWSPKTPLVYLEPGDVWLHATGGKGGTYRSDPVHLALRRDEPRPRVRLVLE